MYNIFRSQASTAALDQARKRNAARVAEDAERQRLLTDAVDQAREMERRCCIMELELLRMQQELTNLQNPSHLKAYPQWRGRVLGINAGINALQLGLPRTDGDADTKSRVPGGPGVTTQR